MNILAFLARIPLFNLAVEPKFFQIELLAVQNWLLNGGQYLTLFFVRQGLLLHNNVG